MQKYGPKVVDQTVVIIGREAVAEGAGYFMLKLFELKIFIQIFEFYSNKMLMQRNIQLHTLLASAPGMISGS